MNLEQCGNGKNDSQKNKDQAFVNDSTMGGVVSAWDISVFDEDNQKQTGRVFADYLSLQSTGTVMEKYYILTNDNYIYEMKFNAASPYTFNIFANNRGITDAATGSILYKSVKDTDNTNAYEKMGVNFTYPGNKETDLAKSFYIFFEEPNKDLEGHVYEKALLPDPATNIKFLEEDGIFEDGGGYFSFDVKEATTATLRIEFNMKDEDGKEKYAPVEISDVVTPYTTNYFYWDGKDGNGKTIEAGDYDYSQIKYTVTTKAGEIHFPITDMEFAKEGITFKRVSNIYNRNYTQIDGANTIYDATRNVIYYDETAIYYGENVARTGISEAEVKIAKGKFTTDDGNGGKYFKYNNFTYTVNGQTKGEQKTYNEYGKANKLRIGDHSYESNKINYKGTYAEQKGLIDYLDSEKNPVGMSTGSGGNSTTTDYGIANYWTFITAETVEAESPNPIKIKSTDKSLFDLTSIVFFDENSNGRYNPQGDKDHLLTGVTLNLYKETGDTEFKEGKTYVYVEEVSGQKVIRPLTSFDILETKYELIKTAVTPLTGRYTFTGLEYDAENGTEYLYEVKKPNSNYVLKSGKTTGKPLPDDKNKYGSYDLYAYDVKATGTEIQILKIGGKDGIIPGANKTVTTIDVGYNYTTTPYTLTIKKDWEIKDGGVTLPEAAVFEVCYNLEGKAPKIYEERPLSPILSSSHKYEYLETKIDNIEVKDWYVSAEYYIYGDKIFKHQYSYDVDKGVYTGFVGKDYYFSLKDYYASHLTSPSKPKDNEKYTMLNIPDFNGDETSNYDDLKSIPEEDWKDALPAGTIAGAGKVVSPFNSVLDRNINLSNTEVGITITNSTKPATIEILKYTGAVEDEDYLKGATFRVYEGTIEEVKEKIEAYNAAYEALNKAEASNKATLQEAFNSAKEAVDKIEVGSGTTRINGKIAFPGLDANTTYTVRERFAPSGYRIIEEYYQVNKKGYTGEGEKFDSSNYCLLEVGNAEASGKLEIRKTIEGRAWQGTDNFTFNIEFSSITTEADEHNLNPNVNDEVDAFKEKFATKEDITINNDAPYSVQNDVTSVDTKSYTTLLESGIPSEEETTTPKAGLNGNPFPAAGVYTFTIEENKEGLDSTIQTSSRLFTIEIKVTRTLNKDVEEGTEITTSNSHLEANVSKITMQNRTEGVLSESSSYAGNTPTFINNYVVQDVEQKTRYVIKKNLTGRENNDWLPTDKFTFTLDGHDEPTKTALQEGNIVIGGDFLAGESSTTEKKFVIDSTTTDHKFEITELDFKNIKFEVGEDDDGNTFTKPITYYLDIKEEVPADAENDIYNGIKYSTDSYTLKIVLENSDEDDHDAGEETDGIVDKIILSLYKNYDYNNEKTNKPQAECTIHQYEDESLNKETHTGTHEMTFENNYAVNIKVTKKWEDINDEEGERPSAVKVKLLGKSGSKSLIERETTLTAESTIGNNIWSHTFEQMPLYDSEGNKVTYELIESQASELYKQEIEEMKPVTGEENTYQIIFTNTYIGPKITQSKAVSSERERSYVGETEKLTYTITVTNAGDLPKEVVVTDSIPLGTTFVKGSIKINGLSTYKDIDLKNVPESDLTTDGITVNVPAKTETPEGEVKNGEVTVSFEVTVDDLKAETFEGTITNTATVDGEETKAVTSIVKKPNISVKKSYEIERKLAPWQTTETKIDPEDNDEVKANDEITYKIELTNTGEALGIAKVKDEAPTGTEFVAGSIKVDGKDSYTVNDEEAKVNKTVSVEGKTEADLRAGIDLPIAVGKTITLEFKVKVKDITDQEKIQNTATVNRDVEKKGNPEEETNSVESTYVEPIIEQSKKSETANEKEYVVEGEKITYTITVTNKGGLAKDVVIKDTVPAGTTLVPGSIKVNGKDSYNLGEDTIELGAKTADDLAGGFTIKVPRKEKTEDGSGADGKVTLTFEVTVNDLGDNEFTKDIKNTATVDDNSTKETTDVVKKPNIVASKDLSVTRGLATWQTEGRKIDPENGDEVKENDVITYRIKLENKGEAVGTAIVKDEIPTGTEFVAGSIKVDGDTEEINKELAKKGAEDLANEGISVIVEKDETKVLEFKVTVKDVNNLDKITNKATVNNNSEKPGNEEKETNPVESTYVKPIIEQSKTSETANDKEYVVEGEVITYTITVINKGGLAKDVVIKDTVPAGTTLVPGSIKVNGNSSYELGKDTIELGAKTAGDLEKGFTVNVPRKARTEGIEPGSQTLEGEDGKVTLTFEVTVNDLGDNEFTKDIKNTATVDDNTTGETTNVVKKPNIVASKDLNVTRGLATWQTEGRKIDPENEDEVKVNDEITYKITLENKGEAVGTAIVKDEIPTGTEFVAGSIKVDGDTEEINKELAEKGADDLANDGISVKVEKGETKVLEFKVKVKDIDNLDKITNKATVNNNSEKPKNPEKETNSVEKTYVEPIIEQTKTSKTANDKEYVVEGETITYTITVTNKGGLAKDVVIKDTIPAGTTLVPGSIKVNGNNSYELGKDTIELGAKTAEDLEKGFTVNVPRKARTEGIEPGSQTLEGEDGKVTLTFEVTVNSLGDNEFTKDIKNTATVDDKPTDEITDTVKKANIEISKKSEPANGTEVKENDVITYTIHLDNTKGTMAGKAVIRDDIPNGTTFVEGSINLVYSVSSKEEKYTQDNLRDGIEVELQAGETLDLSFKVTVKDIDNGETIKNVAYVRNPEKPEEPEKSTNEITHTYVEPIIEQTKTSKTANEKEYVVEGEVITYTITVTNKGGLAKDVEIKDTVPEGTTLVPGSIKVNGNNSYKLGKDTIELGAKTADDLAKGFTVNVPRKAKSTTQGNGEVIEGEDGKVTLSFEVTVNNLPKDVFTKEISNTATVDREETGTVKNTVKKPNVTVSKEAVVTRSIEDGKTEETTINPESIDEVKVNDEITYKIKLHNKGEKVAKVIVKDEAPTGTSFVAGSIKVNENTSYEVSEENKDILGEVITVEGKEEKDLKSGIELVVEVGQEITLEFKVKVQDLTDLANIANQATVNLNAQDSNTKEEETNKVEHTYVEPVISAEKEVVKDNSNTYAVEREILTYKIKVTNTGSLAKEVTIVDEVPEGTTFVAGSIRVNDAEQYNDINYAGKEQTELASGIKVKVPAKTIKNVEGEEESQEVNGEVTLSFKVKVEDLVEEVSKQIKNSAKVDEVSTNEVTIEVSKPRISVNKKAEITSENKEIIAENKKQNGNTSEAENKVTTGDIITYQIELENSGTLEGNAKVRDTIPEGTTFVEDSLKINGKTTYNEVNLSEESTTKLADGINITVPLNQKMVLEFKVKVSDNNDMKKIANTASVNKEPQKEDSSFENTNEIVYTYVKPIIKSNKSVQNEYGLDYAVERETLTYEIEVTNEGSLAKEVTILDKIPEGTTFVKDSIKVNGKATYNEIDYSEKTQADLEKGIKVRVPAKTVKTAEGMTQEEVGKVTLSFEVKVDDLKAGEFTKQIENTASVDEQNTDKVSTLVDKPSITARKEAEVQKAQENHGEDEVSQGDVITYKIVLQNTGTSVGNPIVKDTIPNGTTFIEDSIKINSQSSYKGMNLSEKTADDLAEGIQIEIEPGEEITLEFKVSVEDMDDMTKITNKASVKKEPRKAESTFENTNEITYTYVKPIISAVKTVEKQYKPKYAVSGERLTYKIIVTNKGGMNKEVIITDEIPEGTTFVAGSIKVNGEAEYNGVNYSEKTQENLSSGINLNVPAKSKGDSEDVDGVTTLSFEVIVAQGVTGDIKNIATVDEKETNEIRIPIVTYEKTAKIIKRDTNEGTSKNTVFAGDSIKYEITVHNTGSIDVENVNVKDSLPYGTKLAEGEDSSLEWVIKNIPAGRAEKVGFTVEAEYIAKDYTITNKAQVDGLDTNETQNEYKKSEILLNNTLTKKGTEKVTSKNTKVYYEVNFKASIDEFVGKAKVTLVDKLPFPIDESNSKLAGGKYNDEEQTITWEQTMNGINTVYTGKEYEISITKTLELKYIYESLNNTTGSMENKVESSIELQSMQDGKYETLEKEQSSAQTETKIEIPSKVIVHHYLYNEETEENTNVKLVEDETIKGIVGKEYKTSPSEESLRNYECMNENAENSEGKMTEETKEVTYYYKLKTPTISATLTKTADKQVLKKENGVVTYNIKYDVDVKDYVGKVKVELVDKLPAKIDVTKSKLASGKYNEEAKTITWEEVVNNYEGEAFTVNKEIQIVYKDQNVLEDLVNEVTGKVTTYYPEYHVVNQNEKLVEQQAESSVTVKQEYKATLQIMKEWEDNDNLKGKRPESVTIKILEKPSGKEETKVLNEENNWSYIKENINKYDEEGNKITYEITEKETNKDELEYYEPGVIKLVENQTDTTTYYTALVKNKYRLLKTDLKTDLDIKGTKQITKSSQKVDYTIDFKAEIKEYIGEGKVRIVVDLPYKIDEAKSDLNGGKYNDEEQTITWEEDLGHINIIDPEDSYILELQKEISVLYKDIDLTQYDMKALANGEVQLYETEQKDEDDAEWETEINVKGTVYVKYVDKESDKDISAKDYNYSVREKVGKAYDTKKLEIDNYDYVGSSNNEKGKITEEDTVVIYYYTRMKTEVIVKYQDKEGNKLEEDTVIKGQVFDEYKTEAKEIKNYQVIKTTNNTSGKMTKETITVIYTYDKIPTKVLVKYLEKTKDGDVELLPTETIEGFAGDSYETSRKAIENYRAAEPEPENNRGKMTEKEIVVKYYYEKIPSGTLTVKYVDVDTNEDITYKVNKNGEKEIYGYTIKGFVGDEYETEAKEIPYYVFLNSTENTKGKLLEVDDTISYYYRKLVFNFKVEKEISSITLNGDNVKLGNRKLEKVEINSAKIAQSEVVIKYNIIVTNTGELAGKVKLEEIIPNGCELVDIQGDWEETESGKMQTEIELQAGENKKIEVTIKWINGERNFDAKMSTTNIVETQNDAEFAEVSLEDNNASAIVLISVKTGIISNTIATLIALAALVSTVIVILSLRKKENGKH